MPSEPQQVDRLADLARAALGRWGIDDDAAIDLLSLSENAMFRVAHGGDRWVLRVHRPGYHTENGVRSELAWMRALREDAGVATPQALPAVDGELIQHVSIPALDEPRMVVAFAFIDGVEPEPHDLHEAFRQLGGIAVRMHGHARAWRRPSYFERPIWDYEHALGHAPNWGHWRAGFAAGKGDVAVLERADALMRARLDRFGKSPDRFGLIHSDLRLANLLVDGGETKVLDFDDSGFGWFLYDVASSMTFIETDPDADGVIAAWIDGYRGHGALGAEEIAEIPTFMMLRRLIIMGWAGSHPDTDLARWMGDEYTAGTLELAERYLARQAI